MKIVTLLSLAFITSNCLAQDFVNGDFVGDTRANAYSIVPEGWESILNTEPFCKATSSACATIDLASAEYPSLDHGNVGNAQSGRTFMSGLLARSGSHIWHEGIQQTVNGLEPGKKYTLSMHQAVVQQDNGSSFHCFDKSGSWAIYVDGKLHKTTKPTVSTTGPKDINLNWELREITFEATNASHTFYFLPADDDNNDDAEGAEEGIRMGLDNVSLKPVELPLIDNPVAVVQIKREHVCIVPPRQLPRELIQELVPILDEVEPIVEVEREIITPELELLVFPNPTRDYARLKVDREYETISIELLDMQGKLLLTDEFNAGEDTRFKLEGETGTYILRVKVDAFDWKLIRVQKAQ